MKLLEYQGKDFLRSIGIDVPYGITASSPIEAYNAAEKINKKVVVKVQIPTGGRGKAGGIKPADNPEMTKEIASELLGKEIKGFKVKQVLVEEQLDVKKEMYMGITIDTRRGKRVFMFCESGGMEIEEIVKVYPERLVKIEKSPGEELKEYEIRTILREKGFEKDILVKLAQIASNMFNAFVRYDLITLEINPLCILGDERIIAADAKVEVDDNALFRQKYFSNFEVDVEDEMEREAKEIGVTYVKLDGEIGLISSGAGLGMYTIDLMADEGLKPANFLETGGGITQKLVNDSIKLVLKNEKVKGILINLYGGVNSLIEAANGIKQAKESFAKDIPIVVKTVGNQQEEAWNILKSAGVYLIETFHTERAIELMKKVLAKE